MLVNGHLCGSEAIFLEAGILHGAGGPFAFQLIEDSLSQYPFALAVDEHDFLTQLVLVFLHHFAELSKLVVEHVGVGESCQIINQLRHVKVLNYDFHLLFLAYGLRLTARVVVDASLVAHSVFQRAAVDAQWLYWQVVASDVELNDRRVEIFALVETMKLVEFGHVEFELH